MQRPFKWHSQCQLLKARQSVHCAAATDCMQLHPSKCALCRRCSLGQLTDQLQNHHHTLGMLANKVAVSHGAGYLQWPARQHLQHEGCNRQSATCTARQLVQTPAAAITGCASSFSHRCSAISLDTSEHPPHAPTQFDPQLAYRRRFSARAPCPTSLASRPKACVSSCRAAGRWVCCQPSLKRHQTLNLAAHASSQHGH